MAQNIYDNASFFTEYNKLPRSQDGLAGAPEWPALREMVGSVTNSHILDLGCGYGWFCRWASDNGAAKVHGVDISEQMLNKAVHDWPADEKIEYERQDLDVLKLAGGPYDLAYSSLAFHYVKDIKPLFKKIYKSLRPSGRFVFSIEHPIFTAPMVPKVDHDAGTWSLDSYQHEGERIRHWLGEDVKKQHRTITTYIGALLEFDFRLDTFKEWKPTKKELEEHPDWGMEMHRPMFLLVAASKPAI